VAARASAADTDAPGRGRRARGGRLPALTTQTARRSRAATGATFTWSIRRRASLSHGMRRAGSQLRTPVGVDGGAVERSRGGRVRVEAKTARVAAGRAAGVAPRRSQTSVHLNTAAGVRPGQALPPRRPGLRRRRRRSLIRDRQTLSHRLPVVPLRTHVIERGLQIGETGFRERYADT